MGTAVSGFRSTAVATADLLLAAVGLVILWYPAIYLGNALLGGPLGAETVRLLVGVLALGGSYPFVAGDWSYGTLGSCVLAFVVAVVGLELIGAIIIVSLGLEIPGSDPVPQALAYAAAYVIALLFVHSRGDAAVKRMVFDA